jgi:catechol 2,3-dioxygenase-like lactoylglutathione lyase family enzyme
VPVVGVFHTGITVSDLDRSLAFYRDLLGFELLWRRLYEEEYILRLVAVDGATAIDAALMRVPGSEHLVELLEYRGCERRDGSARPCDYGSAHFAVLVDDIRAMIEKLRRVGVSFRGEVPVEVAAGPNKGGLGAYAIDPDGFVVELHQRAPVSSA